MALIRYELESLCWYASHYTLFKNRQIFIIIQFLCLRKKVPYKSRKCAGSFERTLSYFFRRKEYMQQLWKRKQDWVGMKRGESLRKNSYRKIEASNNNRWLGLLIALCTSVIGHCLLLSYWLFSLTSPFLFYYHWILVPHSKVISRVLWARKKENKKSL